MHLWSLIDIIFLSERFYHYNLDFGDTVKNLIKHCLFVTIFLFNNLLVGSVPIDQNRIIDKLNRYLELHNNSNLIDTKGMCNGFSFLVQYYAELKQEDDFFRVLEAISAWDEKIDSLQQPLPIFGDQHNFDLVIEQFINDLVWYQAEQFDSFQNFNISRQKKRTQQFQIAKKENDERDIAILLSPIELFSVTLEELEEIFNILTFYPNTILEFGGKNHATSARILKNGKIFYYDPNESYRMKVFDSINEFVKTIERTKYKKFGHSHIDIEIMAYQYVNKGQKIQVPDSAVGLLSGFEEKKSHNAFTLYHMAIFANEIDFFRSLIKESCEDPNRASTERPDRVIGMTPLLLAVLMNRIDFVEELLKHPQINVFKCSANSFTPIVGALGHCNVDAAELLLKHGVSLFKTSNGIDELADLLNGKGISNILSMTEIPAVIISSMKNPIELEFIKELCRRVPAVLEMKDLEGKSLIDYAIFFKNTKLIELLNEEF